MSRKQTFSKQERLCSRKIIDELFARGAHLQSYPLKMVILDISGEQEHPAQAMFVVPKRSFKKAHDRNKLRRRMKEAYRLNKAEFYARLLGSSRKVALALIYTARKPEEYAVIEKAAIKLTEGI